MDKYTLISMLGGSHLYGLNIEGSDKDIREIFISTDINYILGLQRGCVLSKQTIQNKVDTSYKELRHFIQLLQQANPEAIEMLFVAREMAPSDNLMISEEWNQYIQSNYLRLININKFALVLHGYADQLYPLKTKLKDAYTLRNLKQVIQYIRLMWAGSVFFSTGEFPCSISLHNPSLALTLTNMKENFENNSPTLQWSVSSPHFVNIVQLMLSSRGQFIQDYELNKDKPHITRFSFDMELANDIIFQVYFPILKQHERRIQKNELHRL